MVTRARIKKNRGVTLVELLVATSLMSVVILGATNLYLSGERNLAQLGERTLRIPAYFAVEIIARRIALANSVRVFDLSGNELGLNEEAPQLKVRWDFTEEYNVPNGTGTPPTGTPETTLDDTWTKFGFVNNKLNWQRYWHDIGGNVSETDDELPSGGFPVVTDPGAADHCYFKKIDSTTIEIKLVVDVGPEPLVIVRRMKARGTSN